ncbi:MAG: CrcB family protein [Victivallaceae bacterium]|nr:CrcB family protein [Victivallaceae bacterium]
MGGAAGGISLKMLAAVMAAGAVGTLCRYCVLRWLTAVCGEGFPAATMVVNVFGAFVAGLVFAAAGSKFDWFAPFMPLAMIGFLGAFTTFSTFALECAVLLQNGMYGRALLNFALQNFLGIAAALIGMRFARLLA